MNFINWILKAVFVFSILGFARQSKAQNYCNNPTAFITYAYPQSLDTFTINVDTSINFYGDTFFVKLKFAIPKNDILTFKKRPFIIGVHGGGFISDNFSSNAATDAYLSMFSSMQYGFAPMGWIAASLDYRTGYGLQDEQLLINAIGNPGSYECDKMSKTTMTSFAEAAYKATFDCRTAIDYIFKNLKQFPFIDTNQIYLYGGSAGAITVLHTAFSETDEFYINPNSSQPAMPKKHKLAGVIAYAGAMTNNYIGTDLHHIDRGEITPIMMVHGMIDYIVPYGYGAIGSCPKQYKWNGSKNISDKLCEFHVPHDLFLIDSAGHDMGSGYPVSNTITSELLLFIKDRGLCPKQKYSTIKLYDLQGNIIDSDSCSNTDCNGDYAGAAFQDKCTVCSGGNTNIEPNSYIDCAGKCFGASVIDSCGKCLEKKDSLFNKSCQGCDGIPNSEKIIDSCGVCLLKSDSLFNKSCRGCDGIINSGKVLDSCRVCLLKSDSLFNKSCLGCDGIINSGKVLDSCGVCLLISDRLFNNSCRGCDGIINSGRVIDSCGICMSPSDILFNKSCKGCDGVINSEKTIDSCGKCLLKTDALYNESCRGCDGVLFSDFEIDTCGKCLSVFDSEFNKCLKAGINKNLKNQFQVTPNPFNNVISVCSDLKEIRTAGIEIYNIQGSLVLKETMVKPCTYINSSNWVSGVYLLKIMDSDSEIYISKIIKN